MRWPARFLLWSDPVVQQTAAVLCWRGVCVHTLSAYGPPASSDGSQLVSALILGPVPSAGTLCWCPSKIWHWSPNEGPASPAQCYMNFHKSYITPGQFRCPFPFGIHLLCYLLCVQPLRPESLHLTWRSSWGLNEVKVDCLCCHNSSKETGENGEEGATGAKGLPCSAPSEIVSLS